MRTRLFLTYRDTTAAEMVIKGALLCVSSHARWRLRSHRDDDFLSPQKHSFKYFFKEVGGQERQQSSFSLFNLHVSSFGFFQFFYKEQGNLLFLKINQVLIIDN